MEDNDIILIDEFLNGKLSDNELKEFYDRIDQDEKFFKKYLSYKENLVVSGMSNNENGYDKNIEWDLLKKRIYSVKSRPKNRTIHLYKRIAVAAALVLTFFAKDIYNTLTKRDDSQKTLTHTFSTPKGHRSKIVLSDSTVVWINSGSKITVPQVFADNRREINLEGEAYFDVTSNKKKPFEVNVKGKKIRVLGTSFNVKAYNDRDYIMTTLEHGRIEFVLGKRSYTLTPNEQIYYNIKSRKLVKRKVDTKYYTSWKDGRMILRDANFKTLVRIIEQWYDIEVIYDKSKFTDVHFYGTIKHEKSVEHLLMLMQETTLFSYKLKDNKLYLKKR